MRFIENKSLEKALIPAELIIFASEISSGLKEQV